MVQKVAIGSTIYDVRTFEDICHNPVLLDQCTAVTIGDGYVYPYRNKTDTKPGIYNAGPYMQFVQPQTEAEQDMYSESHVIDFSKASDIRDIMSKQAELLNQERNILTSVDNKFVADIGPNCTPHTAALKMAINEKGIDLDKYETRFGPNFNNDKRLLKRDDITMNKFMMFLNKLDMAATLTIRDANPNVPNPIGHEITVELIPTDEGRVNDESTGNDS